MSDLSTKYLGLNLKSPLVASASPLCESLDNIKRLEDHNLAAVVLPSLFEEQLELESMAVDADLARGAESFPESANFFPTRPDLPAILTSPISKSRRSRPNAASTKSRTLGRSRSWAIR